MQTKNIKKLCLLMIFSFLISVFIPVVSADITPVDIGTIQTNQSFNDMCYMNNNIWISSSTASDYDGWLFTYSIGNDGVISPKIDDYEFEQYYAVDTEIVKVSSNIVAVAYKNSAGSLNIITVYVASDGGIVQSNITRIVLENSYDNIIEFTNISDDTFVIYYTDANYDLIAYTLDITSTGSSITPMTKTVLWDLESIYNIAYAHVTRFKGIGIDGDVLFLANIHKIDNVGKPYLNYTYLIFRVNTSGTSYVIDSFSGALETTTSGYAVGSTGLSLDVIYNLGSGYIVMGTHGYGKSYLGGGNSRIELKTIEVRSTYLFDDDGIIDTEQIHFSSYNLIMYGGLRTGINKFSVHYNLDQLTDYTYIKEYLCNEIGTISATGLSYTLQTSLYPFRVYRVTTTGIYCRLRTNAGVLYTYSGFDEYGDVGELEDTSSPCGYFGCGDDLTIGSSIPTGGEYKRYGFDKYIAGYYKFGSAVTLKNVSLTVFSAMTHAIMENIQCKVNEHSLGLPDSICTVGTHSVITWNDVIDVAECPFIIFSFYNPVPYSGGIYWAIPVSPDDLNGDGSLFGWFSYDWGYLWDEHSQAYPEIRAYEQDPDKELYIRFCADYGFETDCIDFLDESLIIEPSIGCTNTPFEITYSLLAEDFCIGKTCNILVNKSGSTIETLSLSQQQGKKVYYPSDMGVYYFNMTANNVLKISKSITVNCEKLNYVKSEPNPSTIYNPVKISYGYNSVLSGRIEIITTSIMSGDETIHRIVYIEPEKNGSFIHTFKENGIYSIRLYVNSTNYLLDEITHYVGETGIVLLESDKQIYELGDNIRLRYQHPYIGNNIYIAYSGGELIKHIGDSATGTHTFRANKTGVLKISIYLKSGDGFPVIKAFITITVKEPQPVFGITIDAPYTWFLGIFICVFFMLIPFFIKSIFKLTDEIPMLFYLITTIVGIVISTVFGFFPIWTPFFILFIAILIIVVLWLQGKKDSG